MSKARLRYRQLMHSLSDPDLHDYQVWKNSKYVAVYSKRSLLLGEAFEGCLTKLGLISTVIVLLQLSQSCRQMEGECILIAFDLIK